MKMLKSTAANKIFNFQFEIHWSFEGHFLNELRVSFKFEIRTLTF